MFYFFSVRGGRKEASEHVAGVGFLLKIEGGGGGGIRGGGGGGQVLQGCLRGGGGLNIFFSGPKCPPSCGLCSWPCHKRRSAP